MAVPAISLTLADDFGFVARGDDVSACASDADLCKVVDDAVVYMRSSTEDQLSALLTQMANPPPGMQIPPVPSGRIPQVYRAVLAMREFKRVSGRAIALPELLFVLRGAETSRYREDDFWMTLVLVKGLAKIPLTEAEQAAFNSVLTAAQMSQKAAGTGIGTALVLAATGAVVAGPPGGVVGFVVGLVAGRK